MLFYPPLQMLFVVVYGWFLELVESISSLDWGVRMVYRVGEINIFSWLYVHSWKLPSINPFNHAHTHSRYSSQLMPTDSYSLHPCSVIFSVLARHNEGILLVLFLSRHWRHSSFRAHCLILEGIMLCFPLRSSIGKVFWLHGLILVR